jgi:hypothetical protein
MIRSSPDESSLIGYDARIPIPMVARYWPIERRRWYLPRIGVSSPLSVDRMVWASVFDDGETGCGMAEHDREVLGLTGHPLRPWVGPNRPFWESLNELTDCLVASSLSGDRFALIEVHGFGTRAASPRPRAKRNGPHGHPDLARTSRRALLGFDVADTAFVSGIANLGFDRPRADCFPTELRAQLNSHCLFADLDSAYSLTDVLNVHVPQHAPFHVYGVVGICIS